jgi:hypothetical protein
MIAKLKNKCRHPVKQQFGICEHCAGHLVFLHVLLSISNPKPWMATEAATRPDGALAAVAFVLNTYARTFRNS